MKATIKGGDNGGRQPLRRAAYDASMLRVIQCLKAELPTLRQPATADLVNKLMIEEYQGHDPLGMAITFTQIVHKLLGHKKWTRERQGPGSREAKAKKAAARVAAS